MPEATSKGAKPLAKLGAYSILLFKAPQLCNHGVESVEARVFYSATLVLNAKSLVLNADTSVSNRGNMVFNSKVAGFHKKNLWCQSY